MIIYTYLIQNHIVLLIYTRKMIIIMWAEPSLVASGVLAVTLQVATISYSIALLYGTQMPVQPVHAVPSTQTVVVLV